jgi:hypothetical protein
VTFHDFFLRGDINLWRREVDMTQMLGARVYSSSTETAAGGGCYGKITLAVELPAWHLNCSGDVV